jgi:hypothetical protein
MEPIRSRLDKSFPTANDRSPIIHLLRARNSANDVLFDQRFEVDRIDNFEEHKVLDVLLEALQHITLYFVESEGRWLHAWPSERADICQRKEKSARGPELHQWPAASDALGPVGSRKADKQMLGNRVPVPGIVCFHIDILNPQRSLYILRQPFEVPLSRIIVFLYPHLLQIRGVLHVARCCVRVRHENQLPKSFLR